MSSYGTFRDYIHEGDWVQAQSNLDGKIEEGIVKADLDGELRIDLPDRDPVNDPDGLPVNAGWVNILIWKKA